jgi:hypothetical protein
MGRGCQDTPLERLTLRDDLLMRCQAISAGRADCALAIFGSLGAGHLLATMR